MFIAVAMFRDAHDNGHRYLPGDEYPREGYTPDASRIAELTGSDNRRGYPLIVDTDAECAECAIEAPEVKPRKGTRKRAKKDD